MQQSSIDKKNSEFWNELCGTGLAKSIGITDHGLESLRRFDAAYFDMYPYLLPIVMPERMAGKDVLEIGLGYGSLGQQIATAGARYVGLDIATKPVEMTEHRLRLYDLPGTAMVGSALQMPFEKESFDHLVSIGCFHHTGNVQRCFDETLRVLRPGGTACLMVYNKFSIRQWARWPRETTRAALQELLFRGSGRHLVDERQRAAYDPNLRGEANPETELFSMRDLRRMLSRFEAVSLQKQNTDPLVFRQRLLVGRKDLLPTLGRRLGLDIYIRATKPR